MDKSVATVGKPAGRQPHPAMKWSLLAALVAVVVLGVPRWALAGQPSVSPPIGPQSGGVFTGPYTFGYYIYCTSGLNYNSSTTRADIGTHTYRFYGAPDGSLSVSVDGGGGQLLESCGDPTGAPKTEVASYAVDYEPGGPSSTPTPAPAPTPSPTSALVTPRPPIGPGGTSSTPKPGQSATPKPGVTITPTPTPLAAPVAGGPTQPSPSSTPHSAFTTQFNVQAHHPIRLWTPWVTLGLLGLALLAGLCYWLWRNQAIRSWIQDQWFRLRLLLGPRWFRLYMAVKRLLQGHGHDQPKPSGLSVHKHSGKLLAHHHTSYSSLAFLLVAASLVVGAYSVETRADANSSSVVSLTVLGPPPSSPATIDVPAGNSHFGTSTTTVEGTCPAGLMVEIWRSSSFAGSAACDAGGNYSLVITLVPNENDLVAKDADGLGQYGPDSAQIIVYYDVPAPMPTPKPVSAPTHTPRPGVTYTPIPTVTPQPTAVPAPSPFLITTAEAYAGGLNPGDQHQWHISFSGGQSPYALVWNWGDGNIQTLSATGNVTDEHSYSQPGSYRITIRATDAAGREAVLTLVAIVNGQPVVAAATTPLKINEVRVGTVWVSLIITGFAIFAFWLGEQYHLAVGLRKLGTTLGHKTFPHT